MNCQEDHILLKSAAGLMREKENSRLLLKILEKTIEVVGCDCAAVYIFHDDILERHIQMKFSRATGEVIEINRFVQTIPKNHLCFKAVKKHHIIHISPCKRSRSFQSMLLVPMQDTSGKVIGIIQLINAWDEQHHVVDFTKQQKQLLTALASLGGLVIANLQYVREIQELFQSFVRVISIAIDERTPFNARHTRSMVAYGTKLVRYINQQHRKGKTELYFSSNHKEQFIMSIWLHDIGKIVTPNHIMNKKNRLDEKKRWAVYQRLDRMKLLNQLDTYKGLQTAQQEKERAKEIEVSKKILIEIDNNNNLTEEYRQEILRIGKKTYREENGIQTPWLTQGEIECLLIPKGTLTAQERRIMEKHVVFTEKLLSQIHFTREFDKVCKWASAHHEYLDGSGYPNHLTGAQIPIEVRILTILDIFDALTARDRPYKEPVPIERALRVLEEMSKEGKLDATLVCLFRKSQCWK